MSTLKIHMHKSETLSNSIFCTVSLEYLPITANNEGDNARMRVSNDNGGIVPPWMRDPIGIYPPPTPPDVEAYIPDDGWPPRDGENQAIEGTIQLI